MHGPRGAAVLAMLSQWERSQWLDAAQQRAQQGRALRAMLEHARRHCAYYRERLPQELDRWRDVPLLRRSDVQAHASRLHASTYPRSHGKVFNISTGGSTAEPVTVRRTALTQLLWQAATLRDHVWHQRDLSGTMAIIRQFPKPVDPQQPGRWGGVLRSGVAWHLPIATDVKSQVDWLQSVNPDILLTYPPNLQALMDCMRRYGVRLPHLREVRTVSGAVTPTLRQACADTLGVALTDLYSAQEVGVIALQCPVSGWLHLQAEHLLVEVLDEQGGPCREGEVGQVVVTDLHNYAMPLIRYALGDWAEPGPVCPCGRGLPTLRRVWGRTRNMAVSPLGTPFWPVLDTQAMLGAIPQLRQYQLVQTAFEAITGTLVCDPPPSPQQLQHLQLTLERALGHAYRWTWQLQASPIAHTRSGKFEEFVCRVGAEQAPP